LTILVARSECYLIHVPCDPCCVLFSSEGTQDEGIRTLCPICPEVAFAIQRPCEIHVHMIDAPGEPRTWLNRRPRGHRVLKKKNLGRGNICTCQVFAATTTTIIKGDGRTRNTHVGIWSRYHGHFVRLRLSLLAFKASQSSQPTRR